MVNLVLKEQVCLNFDELKNSTSATSNGVDVFVTDGCRPSIFQVSEGTVTEIAVPQAYRSRVYDARENVFWALHGTCLDRLDASFLWTNCLNFDFISEPIRNVSFDAATERLLLTTATCVYEAEKTGEVVCVSAVPLEKSATAAVAAEGYQGVSLIDNGCFCQLYVYDTEHVFQNAFVFPEGYCVMAMWQSVAEGSAFLNVFLRSPCAECVPMLQKYRILEEGQF